MHPFEADREKIKKKKALYRKVASESLTLSHDEGGICFLSRRKDKMQLKKIQFTT